MTFQTDLVIGTAVLILGITWMLTRRVRTTGLSKASRAKLAAVIDTSSNAILQLSKEGLVQSANERLLHLTGRGLSEVAGMSVDALLQISPQDPQVLQHLAEGLASQRSFHIEIPCLPKSGAVCWLLFTFTPSFGRGQRLASYVGVGADVTNHRRMEEDLVRINRHNELLLNAAGEGIYGLDHHGNISFINPAAARITGWDAGDLIGKPASSILHQLKINYLPGTQEDHFIGAAFLDGSVLIGDADYFRRKDGTQFPVEYTSTAIRESGKVVGTVVIFRDITDRKLKEGMRARQARQSALRADIGFALAASDSLRSILQRCAQAIVKHLDGALARVWTLHPEENVLELETGSGADIATDPHFNRIPVGSTEVGIVAKERVPKTTNDLLSDLNVTDLDWIRREKIVSFVGFPLFVENRLVGVIAMYSKSRLPEDTVELLGAVTDSIAQGIVRKRSEEKVIEQAALLDKSQDAIIVMELSNKCAYWNKSAERLYGWPAKEAQGKKVDQLIFHDASYFARAKDAVIRTSEWKGECCQVTRGDEPFIVESQWTLVHDEAGTPKSILIINTDISERKKIEAQFLRTQRMESIGTLAGGIAHDLNNVLAPILLSVEILKEKFKDDQSRRMLSILESSAKRGAGMVKQVLTFARGVDGERALLQTRHLIKEVGKIIGETFPKTIKLRINVAENLWTTMGDATQLHQVLVNLAVNARDAMPDGGSLTITAENTILEPSQVDPQSGARPGFYVVIKVSDTGTGIPPEVLEKIFEPFFTTKEIGKGTGLGLSTVLSIVKSHEGFLQVQTEINKGTTFLVHIPALEHAQNPAGETEERQMPNGHGETILAVDDEASVLSMTRETLETFGYRVLTARDGTEAIAVYSAHRDEIKGVLTDMLMPFMDGPATIRVLRKLNPSVRIIAASGLMDNDKVKDSTGMDNISFLMKPYTAEKLLATIHRVLSAEN